VAWFSLFAGAEEPIVQCAAEKAAAEQMFRDCSRAVGI
jgi:hypothetical protein